MKTSTRLALFAALAVMALLAPGAMRADPMLPTITTFYVNGTTTTGETLSVTLSIDLTTGLLYNSDLMLTGAFDDTFTSLITQGPTLTSPAYYSSQWTDAAAFNYLFLYFPVSSLIGYAGGELCDLNDPCPSNDGNVYSLYMNSTTDPLTDQTTTVLADFTSLTVTTQPVATSPEPPAVALLAAGLVGLLGLGWRRKSLA